MFTWPSAPVLAQYVWTNRAQMQGATIVEVSFSLIIFITSKNTLKFSFLNKQKMLRLHTIKGTDMFNVFPFGQKKHYGKLFSIINFMQAMCFPWLAITYNNSSILYFCDICSLVLVLHYLALLQHCVVAMSY
jgi:hypothetical protein